MHELLPDSESELKERIAQLEIMSFLRSEKLHELIIKEEQKMTIVYDIRKDLRYKEGVSQGLSQGKTRALLSTARNMIKKDLDIQLIHEITSLSITELKKLYKEVNS